MDYERALLRWARRVRPEFRVSPDDPCQIERRETRPQATAWEPWAYYKTAAEAERKVTENNAAIAAAVEGRSS